MQRRELRLTEKGTGTHRNEDRDSQRRGQRLTGLRTETRREERTAETDRAEDRGVLYGNVRMNPM